MMNDESFSGKIKYLIVSSCLSGGPIQSGVKPQSTVVEPCGLAPVGVPLMALKMPIESDRVLLVASSTGFIWNTKLSNRHLCFA